MIHKTDKLHGVMTPIVTPFRNGEIDYRAFDHLVTWQIEQGVSGIVLNSLIGEGPTLSALERRSLISRTVHICRGRVAIIVATGTCSTETTLRQTAEARELGADFALIVQPYYNRPTQKGIIHHFEQIAGSVDLPIILDNDPQHAGVAITSETFRTLLEMPNIVGVLENPNSPAREYSDDADAGTGVRLARNECFEPRLGKRFHGSISALANIVPDLVIALDRAIASEDFGGVEHVYPKMKALLAALHDESDPAALKYALSCVRGICHEVRLPGTPVPPETAKTILRALKKTRTCTRCPQHNALILEAQAARNTSSSSPPPQ